MTRRNAIAARRVSVLVFSVVGLAAAAFAANLPDPWRSWLYSRPIPVSGNGGPSELALPVQIFPHVENRLADLRIIDDRGAEVPYILLSEDGRATAESRAASLRENSYVPGGYTQVVVDLGEHVLFHNSVSISTPETDFINWVEVAASDDARTWRIVKARAPISRFNKENLAGNQTVRYSENNARYLRLRVFEPNGQFPVTSATVSFAAVVHEAERKPLPVPVTPDPSVPSTLWTADFGTDRYPVSEIAFETTQPEFYRAVRILTSEDAKEWQFFSGGEIYRYKVGDKLEESLRVRFYDSWGSRFWRIEIVNANDAPLSSLQPAFLTIARALFFYPQPGRAYRLLYGNARAQWPQYDLARTAHVTMASKSAAPTVEPGPEELTSNYADPRPFTERHPTLLWVALAVAIILLAFTALRTLRTASS